MYCKITLTIFILSFINSNLAEYTKVFITGGKTGKYDSHHTAYTEIIDIVSGERIQCESSFDIVGPEVALVQGFPLACGGNKHERICTMLKHGVWERQSYELNSPRYFSSATVVPNIGFWINGGYYSGRSSEYFNGKEWVNGPGLPVEIRSHCSVQINPTTSMILGGDMYYESKHHKSNKAWRYDWTTETWSEAASMKTGRSSPMCGFDAKSGKVIVTGGDYNGKNIKSVEIYDPDTDTWSDGIDLPVEIIHGVMVNMGGSKNDGSLILMGGEHFPNFYKSIYKWQSDSKSWNLLRPQLKYTRYNMAAMAVPDALVFACTPRKK